MSNKLKKPCKHRTKKRCLRAPKSCKYVSGKKRSYCRKHKNSRRKTRKNN